jgi:23S rRNA (cytosine1962-C5)-methyltransferase
MNFFNVTGTKLTRVNLHPASIKYLKLGHPWITEDSFTKRFPKDQFFLIGKEDKSSKEVALLLNDPEHKNVKARLWSLNPDDWRTSVDFLEALKNRIENALEKREKLNLLSERENFYLINAESDLLPGLIVLLLKNQLFIQYYALFWKKVEVEMLAILHAEFKKIFPQIPIEDTWIQERNFDQTKHVRSLKGNKNIEFILNEFNTKYKIRLNDHYDFGIYTDMSANRKTIKPYLLAGKSLLNLYSYTGAFSLFALKNKIPRVVSVDLSSKYLDWLGENIALNNDIDASHHTSMCMPTEKALLKLIHDEQTFDTIVCDPPSASSDGQSTSSALKSYEKILPLMLDLLSAEGKLIVFLNTHAISWNKFEEKLKFIIDASVYKNKAILGKRFKLTEDCLPQKGFHEGDYLKGFLIEFKNNKKD